MIPSPFPAILRIVSVYQGKYQLTEKKEKNTDRTKNKLNAPHVRYNVKTLHPNN